MRRQEANATNRLPITTRHMPSASDPACCRFFFRSLTRPTRRPRRLAPHRTLRASTFATMQAGFPVVFAGLRAWLTQRRDTARRVAVGPDQLCLRRRRAHHPLSRPYRTGLATGATRTLDRDGFYLSRTRPQGVDRGLRRPCLLRQKRNNPSAAGGLGSNSSFPHLIAGISGSGTAQCELSPHVPLDGGLCACC